MALDALDLKLGTERAKPHAGRQLVRCDLVAAQERRM
jgi:hypothetical protein